MRALADHQDAPSVEKAGLLSTAPAAGASIVRSRLFIKYVVLFAQL
jgi:hypothetical protein